MSNSFQPEVKFEAAGKSYTLVFTENSFCSLEDITGRGWPDLAFEMKAWAPPTDENGKVIPEEPEAEAARVKLFRLSLVRALLWAGLQEHHDKVTLKQAGRLIGSVGGMAQAMALICEAMAKSFPQEQQPNPQDAAKETTAEASAA